MATTMPIGITAIGITAIGMPGAGIRATGPVTLARSPLWWLRINSLEIKAVKSLEIVGGVNRRFRDLAITFRESPKRWASEKQL
jgi:hypothetical protein